MTAPRCAARALVAAIVALAVPDAVAGQGRSAGTAGDAEAGRRDYLTYACYYCHGTVGQGGRDGPRIARTAREIAPFIAYVRSPTGAMPPYREAILSDAQLTDILAFLKSLPEPPALDAIPVLSGRPR
jgi:ubiquinol-cytochrome c reductase cytochrome c subunit